MKWLIFAFYITKRCQKMTLESTNVCNYINTLEKTDFCHFVYTLLPLWQIEDTREMIFRRKKRRFGGRKQNK